MSNSEEKANTNTNGVAHPEDQRIQGGEELRILGQLKSIEQINEQRRIFLKSTIDEEVTETDKKEEKEEEQEQQSKPTPPSSLALNVKYATLPSPTVATLRSPLSPPPKPPMLSRTKSTGSGDARSPVQPSATPSPPSTEEPATISARHYESLIEELRCPGCAGAMKAPVLLCKSGHSVCEQCTRILLMCPLCKESFTNSRSLTVEALCAKAHFRCSHGPGGCQVRMPVALLPWHEQQCIYKPMKCFMGRVWGDCKWQGREVQWKEHLEEQHEDKLFNGSTADLVWNMAVRRKPLTGYYVFQAHDEMFNFYEIYDKSRILFTMTCTSNRRESKYNYAYEVTVVQPDNEALSLTQKFPVHSEYDRDILMEGTCVSIGLNELMRFVDAEKQVLHYRVSVLAVKSPRRFKPMRQSLPVPMDYQQTKNAGVNGKSVPSNMIITRTYKEAVAEMHQLADTPDSEESLELERKWGTPQLHFNRKYLKNSLAAAAAADDPQQQQQQQQEDELGPLHVEGGRHLGEDKLSLCSSSGTNSYAKKMSATLRKSFRALKTDIKELRPFHKKAVTTTPTANAAEAQSNGA